MTGKARTIRSIQVIEYWYGSSPFRAGINWRTDGRSIHTLSFDGSMIVCTRSNARQQEQSVRTLHRNNLTYVPSHRIPRPVPSTDSDKGGDATSATSQPQPPFDYINTYDDESFAVKDQVVQGAHQPPSCPPQIEVLSPTGWRLS